MRQLLPIMLAVLLAGGTGCAYRYYAEDLKPQSEARQGENRVVADDGTVTFSQGRLEVSLRPMSDTELNRQFANESQDGINSTNPFTFANSKVFLTNETPRRFTVFRLKVSNYEFPKVYLDPKLIYILADNGRKYYALNFEQLNTYHRRYSRGGLTGESQGGVPGNEYQEWKARQSILRRTLFPDEQIFSAQEVEGYVVFRPLDHDVDRLTVHVPEVTVRFDFKGDPVETTDVSARFERAIGKIYPDGRKEMQTLSTR